MKAKQKLYRILCILLTCMMVLNAPMSVLAFEDVQIVDVVEEAEIVADEEFSSDEVTFTDEEIVSEEILFSEEISEESTEEPEEQVLDNSLEDAVEPGLFEDESSELGEGIEEVMSVDTMELFSEGIERLTSSTIPEGMNIERITEVTQIAKGDEITFSMWGMEYSAPSYVATVPAGTETVTVTFKGGTHPDPYGNPAKLSGCMVTYNADEGSGSAGGTESDVVQGEDGLYSINLDVASMIEDSKYYGAYDSSYKTLYLLGFTYAEDETHEHSYENGSCTVCGEADPDYVAPDGITIPEGMNIERITEVTQITAGDEITFSMWGTESSAPSYVATVPAGTETVTVTFKSGTHPTPYGSPAKLSGCMVTYNADEGSVSAGGTESDAVQGEDGLYSINLDVASMIEDSKYYGAYDSSYKTLYLLGFAYAEDEGGSSEEPDEPNAPFLSISIGENELDKDSILYKCLYKLGSWESSYSYVHEVPYYHVIVPMGTTHVDVTYGADADIFDDGSTVYGYSTTLDGVDAVSSATVRSTTLRDSYTLNDDGTQTIKIPVTDYQFNDKCEGKAITAEGEGEGYPALTLFTFEYKDHTHKYADETTDPTCTTGGYTVYTCTCGHSYKGDEVNALGHTWSEWAKTAEPNCTDSGSETRTCTICSEQETQSVAALGHSWSDWAETKEATCTEDGEETRACSVCQANESKTIAATGHNYVDKICSVCSAVDASPEQVNGVYQISNADELMWFAQTVNSGNSSISAVLTADIDLTDKAWTAIGDFNKPFAGSFDGQNHTVTFDNTYGLFYRVRGASNSARAEIKNVIIKGTALGAGVAYYVQFANFENCINRADVSAGGESCAAGIVGDSPMILWNDIAGHVKIINCVNEGNITGSEYYSGGIFGYAVGDMVVADCSNTGNINGGQNVGGIGGYFQGSKASYITNAYNTGKVTGTGVVGGIVGSVHNGTTIANCYNAGEAKYGVTGQIYNHTATIKNTYWLVAASAQGVPASYSSNSNAIGDNISAVSKTRAEMVSEEFAALLGGSFKASCPAAVLTWQTANAHDMMEIPGVGTVCVRCGLGTKSTFDVTKSIDDSYTISGDDEAVEGEDYTFTVEITEGYEKSPNFTVTVGTEVMEEKEGVYTVENVAGPLSIIVTGVVKIPTSHTITLPATGNGYAVVSEEGYTTTVDRNGDYKFTVEFADGFRAGKNLKVMANDEKLSADDNGVYTISNIVADQKIEISGTEMIPYDDTVNVSFTITKGIDEFYVGKSGDILAQEVIEVPYFDLELYDLERYYYNPYCYVDKDGKPVNQTAGTKETAYGVITAMHAYICATEIYYLGMDPDDVGQGFADENAKNDFNEAISWTQGAGSSFMNLWGDGTNLNYYVNYVYPLGREEWGATSDQIALKDGDIISIHFIEGNASGSNYGFFVADDDNRSYDTTDTIETKTVVQGDKITLTLYNAGAAGNYLTGYSRMKEQKLFWTEELTADIYKWNYHKAAVDLEEGEANTGFANLTSDQMVTDENGNITIDTTNLNPGTYYIASKGGVSAGGMVDSDGFTSRGNESGPALFVLIVEGSGQKTEDEQQAATVTGTITALPAVDQLTVADADKVEAARAAYDALTDTQKALVSSEILAKLAEAEAKIEAMQNAEEQETTNKEAAGNVTNKITILPTVDSLTIADAEMVKAARAAYDALTDEQKALVSSEVLTKLTEAEAKIAELKKAEEEEAQKPQTHVHSWDAGTVTKAATCKDSGVKTFKCSCGETKTESVAKTTSHKYGAWTVESEATVKAAEIQKHSCSVCKKEETKDVGKALTPVLEVPGKLKSFNVKKGKTAKFTVTMANGDSVSSVKSSKTKYLKASLDKKTGKITLKGVKKGTSKLTIKLASGKSRTYTVKVVTGTVKTSGLSVTNVTDKKLTLTVKKSHTLKSEVKPFTSTQKVTYKSSNKKIAKVTSGGKITAVAPGKATITATSGSKKVKITVTVPGIENVKSSVSVKKNKTLTLKPKTYGISEKVTYTSSNTKVATVTANGKIKGIKKGTAKITIKAGTFTKTVKVTVK